MRKRVRLVAMCLASVVFSASARAESCGTEATAELARIEHLFRSEQRRARLWWYGWLGYAAIEGSLGGLAYARAHGRLNRDLWLTTWLGSAALAVELAAFPMVSAYAATRLSRMPRTSDEARCRAHQRATQLLERAAITEREGTNLLAHVLGAGWAAGTTSYLLGRNYDRGAAVDSAHNRRVLWESSVDLMLTVAITELAIWTQPTDAMRYRAARVASAQHRSFAIHAGFARVALQIAF